VIIRSGQQVGEFRVADKRVSVALPVAGETGFVGIGRAAPRAVLADIDCPERVTLDDPAGSEFAAVELHDNFLANSP
jgi:hypothetical protein